MRDVDEVRLADIMILLAVGLIALLWFQKGSSRLEQGKRELGRRQMSAVHLLEEKGYQLVGHHLEVPVQVDVDGRLSETRVGCDLAVERDGQWFAVVLRRGEGWRLTAALVRRRLMEIVCAFQPDGVLLVDPEAGKIRVIKLTVHSFGGRRRFPWVFLAGFAIGIAVTVFAVWRGYIL
ncbi:MAG TPA: hypothetical protein GXZ96_07025 [Firmicutes bacterium]|nr:hypothetical protein [Bacillota bacterium]